MTARSYTAGRAEKVARITGKPFEIQINDGAPYRCVTHTTPAQLSSLVAQAGRLESTNSLPGDYSSQEYLLRILLDPAEHERLHDEFRSDDPDLMIVLAPAQMTAILSDFITYLGGADIPFESSEPSSATPSIIGGSSAPRSQPRDLVSIR